MEKCEKHLSWGSAMLKHPLKTHRISQDPSIPKQCLPYLLYVGLHSQSSCFLHPLVRGLPGPGGGIHIAPLLPRASAKWPWGKQDQWRILLDLESFRQAFINLSFKTEAPFPLYIFYGETDEKTNSDCYKKRNTMIWGKFTWNMLSISQLAYLSCFCNSL